MYDSEGREGELHSVGEFRDADVSCVTVETSDSQLRFATCDHRVSTQYIEKTLIRRT
jgi:hypothetical protein